MYEDNNYTYSSPLTAPEVLTRHFLLANTEALRSQKPIISRVDYFWNEGKHSQAEECSQAVLGTHTHRHTHWQGESARRALRGVASSVPR